MVIPDPSTYADDLQSWANSVVSAFNLYPSIMPLEHGMEWQLWGLVFFNDPDLGVYNPPNPFNYETWQEWGTQLCAAFDGAPDGPLAPGTPSAYGPGAYLLAQNGIYLQAQNGNLLTTQPNG